MKRFIAGAFAVASLGGLGLLSAQPANAAPAGAERITAGPLAGMFVTSTASATVQDPCYKNWHSRPASTGVYSDPCAESGGTLYSSGGEAVATWSAGISFAWTVDGGGARITSARGYTRLVNTAGLAAIDNMLIQQINLGRTNGGSGVVADLPSPQSSPTSLTATTSWWSAKGCGAQDQLSGGFALWTHSWWKLHNPYSGWQVSSTEKYSGETYYRVTDVGTNCT